MEVRISERVLRFRTPMVTANGRLTERVVLELDLDDGSGVVGLGEAAPLESYDGVSLQRARRALEAYRPVLERAGELPGAQVLDGCRDLDPLPQALAAVDMALWDRAGKREGKPLCELLTDDPVWAVAVNATIGAVDPVAAAGAAAEYTRLGARTLKVKVASGDDGRRVAAVRAAAGPDVRLRLDANGAWGVDEAVQAIEALSPAGLELVEEPVHGLDALRAVRDRVAVRVAMDETAAEAGALASGAADAVCLKLSRAGGISGLLAQASLVRASGSEPYLASSFDGPRGIAAALHAQAALQCELACGLATLDWFEGYERLLPIAAGSISVPRAPGLGVE